MKPAAPLLIAGFLALIGFACTPSPPAPPPPPPPTPVAQVCTNGVLGNVPFVTLSFKPEPPFELTPEPDPTQVNPEIEADLAAAFAMAPASFKEQLCKLDGIYIDRTGCTGYEPGTCGNLSDADIGNNSWGFRTPKGKRYIAISLGLWKNTPCPPPKTACAPPFQTYQTRLTKAVLVEAATQGERPPAAGFQARLSRYAPSYAVAPNTAALSVLASLAHEFGHVLWWDTFVQPPGSQNISNTAEFCAGSFYPSGRWQGEVVDLPPGHWVYFGEVRPSRSTSPTSSLPRLASRQDFAAIAKRLDEIYASGRWASALAAFSPDEYFVETFELSVLLKAGLENFNVDIVSGGVRHRHYIVRDGNVSPMLRSKLECFGPLTR